MVGPPLSAMDADLGFQPADTQPGVKAKDAQRSARQHAAAQEARSMLGMWQISSASCPGLIA